MLEIDTPGHTSSIGESHPEYIACKVRWCFCLYGLYQLVAQQKSPWATYANEPPAGQLRLASPAVQDFTSKLFSAVLNPLKGMGTLFSTGGDEINARCYAEDQETQDELKKQGLTFEGALDKFTNVTHKAVRDAQRVPVVWEGEWWALCYFKRLTGRQK